MTRRSTREAAKKLGISHNALAVYVRVGKIPAPENVKQGEKVVHIWTDEEIENVRKLLPKIANGRKTRWQRKREKKNKTQPRAAVPHDSPQHKPKRTKKKRPRRAG